MFETYMESFNYSIFVGFWNRRREISRVYITLMD